MESLPQLEPTRQLNVDRAYVLLWSHSPDGNRSAFQRVQLRRLGIPTRLVVGCDQEDLTPAQRACMFGSKLYGMPKLPKDERKYASQLVKLWAALLDFARSGLAWSGLALRGSVSGKSLGLRHYGGIDRSSQTKRYMIY